MEDTTTNNDVISIGEQDDIVEIIEKIKNASGRTVTLSMPKGAVVLQDITNLKILQKKVKELGKEIEIARSDEFNLGALLERPAAPVRRASGPSAPRFAHLAPRVKQVSDMVRQKGTVDLRQMRPGRSVKQAEPVAPRRVPAPAPRPEPLRTFAVEESIKEKKQDEFLSKLNAERAAFIKDPFANRAPESETAGAAAPTEKRPDLFADRKLADKKGERYDFSLPAKKKKKRSSILPTISAKFFGLFILACLATAGAALFFILPKADISVALKKETIKSDFTLIADNKAKAIDSAAGVLPATVTEFASEKTQSFPTASKKRVTEKATGSITIYNECSTGEQVLVAGTRFLSKDTGKIFKIEAGVTIPGFDKPEDETIPGTATVKVVAEGTGESYNINATAFTIPKLQELSSWKYSCLYARSSAAMTGGLDKEVNYVAQADYDQAVATLTAAVKEANRAKLAAEKSDALIYIEDASEEGKVSVKSASKVGDVADQFELTVSIAKPVKTVAKADLETLLKDKIKSSGQLENAEAVEGSLAYQVGDTASADGRTNLSLSASQDFAFHLDQNRLKQEVAGKDRQQLNDYFAKIDGIKSVSIKLWPFWVSQVPEGQDKINLMIEN